MSDEQPQPGHPDKPFVRLCSDLLKSIGFRWGAPLYRATASFTIDEVLRGLRAGHGPTAELLFTTTVEQEKIRLSTTAIRAYALTHDADFLGNLFGDMRPSEENCFVIEGLSVVLVPESPVGPTNDFATAAAYDHDDLRDLPPGGGVEEQGYLKVMAVVACDRDGHVVGAVVQQLPSPADQILYVPPL